MNLVDIIIIIILLLGAFVGFKRGFTTQLLSLCGFVVVAMAAFLFKNPVSAFLYEHLPFFNFPGLLSGVSVVNILMYEVIAFFVIFIILYMVLKIIMVVSHIFEAFLNSTILLGIPSKLLGAVLGVLENYLLAFIVLYIVSLPFFDINVVKESKFRQGILKNTPVLNMYVGGTVNVGNEFWDIAAKYKDGKNKESFNLEALDLLLKYKVTSASSIDVLVQNNKIQINNIESVLKKYREE
jgi:uncharacterized membrane protein required for colicin V production